MDRRGISDYIWFGTAVRYLEDASLGTALHGEGTVVANLEAVLTQMPLLGLNVSLRIAEQVGLSGLLEEMKATEADATLDQKLRERLAEAMPHVWVGVIAEGNGLDIYVASAKRFAVDKLLDDVAALFAPGVFEGLSEIAQIDLQEAGRCLALNAPPRPRSTQ